MLTTMHIAYSTAPEILVFRTNIRFKKDLRQIGPVLEKEPGVLKWNVDREDADKVLRIEASALTPEKVIQLVSREGFFCEELPG
ncbi:hypothetical protein ACFOTA_01380 [Chitinophaga sp. GCM10012297]|uniref:Copper chaperone CopZ n=1 Tax=Chitinophaga chungangae TaxID=2821488 RepID=A0ABS3Y843_9BACT|nr:hypothetical protein [Chitinophaga chungangae]MBO9150844.1 hypothetical protein [Chitinophaga chungangae]